MTKSAKEVAAEEYAIKKYGRDTYHEFVVADFIAGWDACLKHLAESGDGFDEGSATKEFFSHKPWLCGNDCCYSFEQGARYQHSKDQLVIQALREEIRELKKTKPQD